MLLLDLDGTLIDTVPDLAYCVDTLLMELGLPVRGEAAIRHWVGNGVERLLHRALLGSLEGEASPALYARALPLFLELYAANTSARSRIYEGVLEGLDYLLTQGFLLACVTNKAARFTLPLLRDLALSTYFPLVVAGDTLPYKKPNPAQLLYAAQHFQVSAEQCWMVGDSVNDVAAARAARFSVVCVSYGYNHGEDIRDSAPDAVIDSLADLIPLLAVQSG